MLFQTMPIVCPLLRFSSPFPNPKSNFPFLPSPIPNVHGLKSFSLNARPSDQEIIRAKYWDSLDAMEEKDVEQEEKKRDDQLLTLIHADHLERDIVLSLKNDYVVGVIVARSSRAEAHRLLEKRGVQCEANKVGWTWVDIKWIVCSYYNLVYIKEEQKGAPNRQARFRRSCCSIVVPGRPDNNTIARGLKGCVLLYNYPYLKEAQHRERFLKLLKQMDNKKFQELLERMNKKEEEKKKEEEEKKKKKE